MNIYINNMMNSNSKFISIIIRIGNIYQPNTFIKASIQNLTGFFFYQVFEAVHEIQLWMANYLLGVENGELIMRNIKVTQSVRNSTEAVFGHLADEIVGNVEDLQLSVVEKGVR